MLTTGKNNNITMTMMTSVREEPFISRRALIDSSRARIQTFVQIYKQTRINIIYVLYIIYIFTTLVQSYAAVERRTLSAACRLRRLDRDVYPLRLPSAPYSRRLPPPAAAADNYSSRSRCSHTRRRRTAVFFFSISARVTCFIIMLVAPPVYTTSFITGRTGRTHWYISCNFFTVSFRRSSILLQCRVSIHMIISVRRLDIEYFRYPCFIV